MKRWFTYEVITAQGSHKEAMLADTANEALSKLATKYPNDSFAFMGIGAMNGRKHDKKVASKETQKIKIKAKDVKIKDKPDKIKIKHDE